MATEVLIPKLGMTMTEGTVAEWVVPDGGEVKTGEVIYRLETEKIEFQVEAETDGIVRHLVPEGTTLPPGSVVGYVLAPGEAMPAGAPAAAPAAAIPTSPNGASAAPIPAQAVTLEGGRVPASPIARRLAKEAGLALESIAGTGPNGRVTEADVLRAKAAPPVRPAPSAAPAGAPVPQREVLASPLARRLAEKLGVDLATVRGSGPGGRITQEDVEAAAAAPRRAPAAATEPAAAQRHAAGEVIPVRGMRKVIAERMHASLQEMAQLTMGMEVNVAEAVKLRTQLVDEWVPEGIRPTYTDLVIKAVAKALTRHPLLNARFTPTGIELVPEVHVGMAVALDDGLVVPVIRDADRLPLRDIAAESTRLATAARNNTLGLDEMSGGTFSVTALGSAGVDFFTPIINPPNVAILGIGRIYDTVAWEGDRPLRTQALRLSLTIDHRAVDGAPAAAFLGEVKALLEAPYRLLV
ncbi:MAG: 2-oxo acid dehydrogenase subunit E2 [Hyphomicrobiales bacterium]